MCGENKEKGKSRGIRKKMKEMIEIRFEFELEMLLNHVGEI